MDPLEQLRALKVLVEGQIEQLMAILRWDPIYLSAVKTKSQDMMGAWLKYEDQYNRLCKIAGRGRVQGFQSHYDALYDQYKEAFEFRLGTSTI